MIAIGLDLGGTSIKAVLLDSKGTTLAQKTGQIDSNTDSSWKEGIANVIKELEGSASSNVDCIGISAPGLPDKRNRRILFMPGRLPGIENFDWRAYLNRDVHVLNDAHAALMAEATLGAAQGYKHVLMLTLGTGVGGAILIDGELYQGKFQRAGSIADMSLDADSAELSATKIPGSLEDAFGNMTIQQRSQGRFQSTKEVVDAYLQDDEFATEVWLQSIKKLSIGICSLINILAPEIVLIGGGIAQADDALFVPLLKYVDQHDWKPGGESTPLIKAKFNEFSGAIGAACFAMNKHRK